jgi:predicted nucleic acid-binding protein
MNVLFDTNILIYLARLKSQHSFLEFINPKSKDIHVSFASIAEVESFAMQNQWSKIKIARLEFLFEESQIMVNTIFGLLPQLRYSIFN